MPRLFTGLDIPAQIRSQLALKQVGVPKMRWIEPSDFHITLRFIGDVELQTANAVVDALSGRQWSAPTIELGELKSFGGGNPTSVHASIVADQSLSNLVSSQDHLKQRIGLPADTRRFTPHVTLGRCRGASARRIATYLAEFGAAPPTTSYVPSGFALYSARQSRGGGPYRIEKFWSFG